ncbi:hypothetical protein OY671_000827 [Metschnikowia pulcherrima]|nr:hypothetical protein OY671_000827 [Metschnikowia pulcherrima]
MTTAPWSARPRTRMAAADRRAQISASASRLIAERGFWGLTSRDVALDCGITEAGVSHHAGSKDGSSVAVLEHRDAVDMAALAERLAVPVAAIDDDPLPVGLRDSCAALVARNATQPEIVRSYTVLQGESLDESHPAYTYFQQREEWVMDSFSRAARTDGLSGAAVVTTARETLAAMDGSQSRWSRSPATVDSVTEWDAFADRSSTGR